MLAVMDRPVAPERAEKKSQISPRFGGAFFNARGVFIFMVRRGGTISLVIK
jgi:hypothetical protein